MPTSPAIHIADIHFAWRKNQPAVLHIPELDIAAGEHVFIQGASGSGKSTLLSLLAGVNLPQQGQVNVLDQTINQLSAAQRDHFRANHIGFVFQLFNLIPYLSVLENVTLPCRFSKQRHQKATKNGNLVQEAIRLLEHLGMADVLHREVTELSVGQQQRVATARALMGSPEIIIADEPTSALDSDRRQNFIELLFAECAASNATLLFVSHDQQLQSLFGRHIALADISR